MKITVFGASGATGRIFCEEALKRGYVVNAFVRPSTEFVLHGSAVYKGDYFNCDDICKALNRSDAVLIAYGLRGNRKTPLYSKGTSTIIESMKKESIKRLLVVSEASYNEHLEGSHLVKKVISGIYTITQKPVISERIKQDRIIADSGLDWTITRPGILNKSLGKGSLEYFAKPVRGFGSSTSRKDLVNLLLKQLKEPEAFLRKNIYV